MFRSKNVRTQAALPHKQRHNIEALGERPSDPKAVNSLSNVLCKNVRTQAALPHKQRHNIEALGERPSDPKAVNSLSNVQEQECTHPSGFAAQERTQP